MSVHITGIRTAAGVELQEVWLFDPPLTVTPESDPALIPLVQSYKHFDLTDEQLGRTRRYNCWAFTFLPRRYWIDSPTDVDQVLHDNCMPVAAGALRPGDVIRYRDAAGVTTHTGRVWQVDAAGNCTLVRSKWGSMAEYVHVPLHPYITPYYGTNLAYFRQTQPLLGLGNLWIRDAYDDNGEQYSQSLWASPDILVDAPPYGSVDVNPVFGDVNRVSVRVNNLGDLDIANVRVRYYWANPYAGFAPSNWQLIPAAPGRPNPTSPFTVPALASAEAPYVEWIPAPVPGVPDPAHQCLLAIAYVNDDPKDSANPDPLVYPFDIIWENNIACRNVHVLSLKAGSKAKLDLATAVPFDGMEELDVDLYARLTYMPRQPVFGFPREVVAPEVALSVGAQRQRPVVLKKVVEARPDGWMPLPRRHAERTLAAATRHVALSARRPEPVHLVITAPPDARPGSNFYLHIEQKAFGQVTGSYTVAMTIV